MSPISDFVAYLRLFPPTTSRYSPAIFFTLCKKNFALIVPGLYSDCLRPVRQLTIPGQVQRRPIIRNGKRAAMPQSSLPNQENKFHFVVSHTNASCPLDKSARRFLANGAMQAKYRNHKGPRNGERSGLKERKYSTKISFSMSSWRVKINGGKFQIPDAKVTEVPRYGERLSSENATATKSSKYYYLQELDGLCLQVPSDPSYGAEPWATELFNYYFHMLVMWRYPVKFRSFSDLFCPPYAEKEASYSLRNRSNFFTTLAVASSHLRMYRRELGFCPFSSQLSLPPVNRFAYYRAVSLETIRHDVCDYDNMHPEDKAALIWAICKMAQMDLFCNDFAAAKIHLMAIARIVHHAGGWPEIEEHQKHMLFTVDVNTAAMLLERPLFPEHFQQRSWDGFDPSSLPALCGSTAGSTLAFQFFEKGMNSALGGPLLSILTQLRHVTEFLEYLMSAHTPESKPEYFEWITYNINTIDHKVLERIAFSSESMPGTGSSIEDIQESCLISILCLNFTIVKPASCHRGIKLAYFLMRSLSKIRNMAYDPNFKFLYLWMACMGVCVTTCPTQRSHLLKLLGELTQSLHISCWTELVRILKVFFYIEYIHGPRLRSLFEKTVVCEH